MIEIKNDRDLYEINVKAKLIVIYGCGDIGKRVQNKLREIGIDNFCFAVSDKMHINKKMVLGTNVYTIDEIKEIQQSIEKKLDNDGCDIKKNGIQEDVFVLFAVSEWLFPELEKKCLESNIVYCGYISPQYADLLEEKKVKGLLENIEKDINQIKIKLSMKNNIWKSKDADFYLPYYPIDFISNIIVNEGKFFEEDILIQLDAYIPDNAVILDVGANIGNHCLYWAIRKKVKEIYAFEPIEDTYNILIKNLKLNNIKVVKAYNYGASDKTESARCRSYRMQNVGDTHLETFSDGNIRLIRLDEFLKDVPKIDFIKVDVEDYEVKALIGMEKLFIRHKPYLFVESYPDYFKEVEYLMEKYSYGLIKKYPHHNYLYAPI